MYKPLVTLFSVIDNDFIVVVVYSIQEKKYTRVQPVCDVIDRLAQLHLTRNMNNITLPIQSKLRSYIAIDDAKPGVNTTEHNRTTTLKKINYFAPRLLLFVKKNYLILSLLSLSLFIIPCEKYNCVFFFLT